MNRFPLIPFYFPVEQKPDEPSVDRTPTIHPLKRAALAIKKLLHR